MPTLNTLYRLLIVINCLVGFFFLGLLFLGSSNINREALSHVTKTQATFGQIVYGLAVSLFFSLTALLLSFIFKKQLLLSLRYRRNLFFIQFLFFLFAYSAIYIYIYILK